MMLKLNCTDSEQFLTQDEVLTQKFLDKGYTKEALSDTLDQVRLMDRAELLKVRPPLQEGGDKIGVPFITNFSNQHHSIKHIVNKHWHILGNDRLLKTILPPKPQVVFRGVPSLRDKLAPNIIDPPTNIPHFFGEFTSYYQCRRCQVCSLNGCKARRSTSFTSSVTSKEFKIEPLITCSSERVVYLLQCPCGLQYVGRATAPSRSILTSILTILEGGLPNIQYPNII